MQNNFATALAHVLREEGGVSDDARDRGGLTKFGITLPVLAAFRESAVRRADLLALTPSEAAKIYRTRYWDAIAGDDLPAGIDLSLFDFAVNSGPARAVKTLQALLHVKVDGVIGRDTLAALAQRDAALILPDFHDARLGFLQSLSVWPHFGRGWRARNDRTLRAALALISATPSIPERTITMTNAALEGTKSVLQSRTVWANMIGLASFALAMAGYGTLDVGGLTDAVLQTVTAGSFIASALFRITAKKKLT